MNDNGERIYQGLMEREPMEELERENVPPKEKGIPWESDKGKLSQLVDGLLASKEKKG